MLIFFYGPDTYRSKQELSRIINEFKKVHKSGLNFLIIDFKESDFFDFKKNLETSTLFQDKKIIILKNLFLDEKIIKEFFDYLKNPKIIADKEKVVIVYEKDIPYTDKDFTGPKKELFGKLLSEVKSLEFRELNLSDLKNWVKKEFLGKNVQVGPRALEKLIFFVGNDLWRMSNEINKLALFKSQNRDNQKTIEESDIEILVRPKIETDVFKTVDAIAQKNKKLALKLIREHWQRGENEIYILSMILWQIRNLIRVKSSKHNKGYLTFGLADRLAKKLHLHPYVVEKTLAQSKKFTILELKKIYQNLLRADRKIKTGKIDPKIALETFIINTSEEKM